MVDLIAISVTAGVLAMLGYLAASEFDIWRKRRRLARIQRVERELAETQRNLQALVMQYQTWLHAGAHEARKAMIMEAFRASREERNTTVSRSRRK